MKNNSDRKIRFRVYVIIIAGMFLVSALLVSWYVYYSYRQYVLHQDMTFDEAYGESERLSSLMTQANRASFGFYYLMKKKDTGYNISPSDVFGGTYVDSGSAMYEGDIEYSAESAWNFGYRTTDDDKAELINSMVEENYYNFIEYLHAYNINYYVSGSDSDSYFTDVNGMSADTLHQKKTNAPFYLELEIDNMGYMTAKATDQNYSGNLSDIYLWYNEGFRGELSDHGIYVTDYPKSMKIYLFSDDSLFYEEIYLNVISSQVSRIVHRTIDYGVLVPSLIAAVLVIVAAWVLMSVKKTLLSGGILAKIPLELAIILAILSISWYAIFIGEFPPSLIYQANRGIEFYFTAPVVSASAVTMIIGNLGAGILLFAAVASFYSIILLGLKRYLKERTFIIVFCRWIGRKIIGLYHEAGRMVFDAKNHKTLVKLILINALIVALLCCLWFPGLIGVIIYSVALFFIAVHFLDKIKAEYDVVQQAARDMADGQLNTDMSGDAGAFEPIREDLAKVREGVKIAVAEEVKSQRMKTELITNVSHDLKTPLTAIITYTNLLKDDTLSEEDRKHYVAILDQKADRLKRLIEDLFEVSKANSGIIQVTKTWLDLSDLVRQATIENEDKLKSASIDLRLSLPTGKTMLQLDGQKMYCVMDNLLGNVAKYSLSGSRAYVSVEDFGHIVTLTVKNISADELPDDADTLTDRFVRGDKSRNTEGSGLGLAIVKSFIEIMDGELTISVDGDLFKVVVKFHRNEVKDLMIPEEEVTV